MPLNESDLDALLADGPPQAPLAETTLPDIKTTEQAAEAGLASFPASFAPPQPGGLTEKDLDALFREERQDENARLGFLLKEFAGYDTEKQANILELARHTGLPAADVEQDYDFIRETWQALQSSDPEQFRQLAPEVAERLLKRPDLVQVARNDNWLTKTLREYKAALDWWTMAGVPDEAKEKGLSPEQFKAWHESGPKSLEEARNPAPIQAIRDPLADDKSLARPFRIFGNEFERNTATIEYSKVGFDLMLSKRHGAVAWELEKRAVDLEQTLIPRYYEQGPFEQFFAVDAPTVLPSQLEVLESGGIGGAVGVGIGGAIGAGAGLLSRQPGAVLSGAKEGAKQGFKMGAKAGAAAASFQLETGGAYLEYRKMKTDSGDLISEEAAIGGAIIYGMIAASVEMWAMDKLLDGFKGLGTAVRSQMGKEGIKTLLLKDAAFRKIAMEAGKSWLKGAGAEVAEEVAQEAAQQAVGYGVRVAEAGELQKGDWFEGFMQSLDAGWTALPGSLLMGMGGPILSSTAQSIALKRSRNMGEQVAAIAQLSEAPTTRAAPAEVAEMVKQASAAGGEPVTHLFIDPKAVTTLLQSEKADINQAATELLGPEGPKILQEALASGDKLAVPTAVYLEKWGTKPIAKALANDTTTHQDKKTVNEQKALAPEVEAQAQELARKNEAIQSGALTRIHEKLDLFQKQLVATGRLRPRDARKAMKIWRKLADTAVAKMGSSAEELIARMVVAVGKGEDPTDMMLRAQEALAATVAAEQKAAPEKTPDKAASGGSPPPAGAQPSAGSAPPAALSPAPEAPIEAPAAVAAEAAPAPAMAPSSSAATPVQTFLESLPPDPDFLSDDTVVDTDEPGARDGDEDAQVEQSPGQKSLAARLAGTPEAGPLAAEDRAKDEHVDDVSGLRNREAWDATPRTPGKLVAVITTPDIKAINDEPTGGHDTANALLAVMGRAVGAVDPGAARGGTNFLLEVQDEAALEAALEAVRQALPGVPLVVSGGIGTTADEAFADLDARVEQGRKEGTILPRGKTAIDLSTLPELEKALAELAAKLPDKAAPLTDELRSAAAARSDEDFQRSVYEDPAVPGVLSGVGWRRVPRKAYTVALDLKGLKKINDTFRSKTPGNDLLQAFGRAGLAAGGAALDFAHLSGDEYAAQSDDPAVLERFVADLRAGLPDVGVPATLAGETVLLVPDFRHGIAKGAYGAADRALNRAKRAEATAGHDVLGAGRLPGGPSRGGAEGGGADGGGQDGVAGGGGVAAAGGVGASDGQGLGGDPRGEGPSGQAEHSGRAEEGAGAGEQAAAAVEPHILPEQVAAFEAEIAKLTSPADVAAARAWLDYSLNHPATDPEPKNVTDKHIKDFARLGIVPRGYVWPFDNAGRRIGPSKAKKKKGPKGRMPAELAKERARKTMTPEEFQSLPYDYFEQAGLDALQESVLTEAEKEGTAVRSIDALIQRVTARREHINALKQASPQARDFPMRGGGRVLVSEDPSKPGAWRATRFAEENGELVPTGHTEAQSYADAIEAAAQSSDMGFGEEGTTLLQPAFHGTPHRFDKFSLHAIGTGEGAQAYGWGLYFASEQGVADYYRKALSPAYTTIDGKTLEQLSDVERTAMHAVLGARSNLGRGVLSFDKALPAAVSALEKEIAERRELLRAASPGSQRHTESTKALQQREAALDVLKGVTPDRLSEKAGVLYRVDVPEHDELLDYDKPVDEQPTGVRAFAEKLLSIDRAAIERAKAELEEVEAAVRELEQKENEAATEAQQAYDAKRTDRYDKLNERERIEKELKALREEVKRWENKADPHTRLPNGEAVRLSRITGRILYQALAEASGGSAQRASEALLAAGIPGLRYLDGGSRNTDGEGSHNFVIWDDGRVSIVNTYEQTPAKAQHAQTPAFKEWFKDSKVVDKDGKPLRVFHGSNYSGFDVFRRELQDPNALKGPGFYFTEDASVAGEYVEKPSRLMEQKGESPGVYPVFLSIQNPLDEDKPASSFIKALKAFKAKPPPANIKRMIDSALREESENFNLVGLGSWIDNTEWAYNIAEKAGKNGEELLAPHVDYILAKARDYMVKQITSREWWQGKDILNFIEKQVELRLNQNDNGHIQDVLKRLGFDGIAHTGGNVMGNGHEHRVWIAFDPGQVKSATGNEGTFDPNNPSILKQDEQRVKDESGARGYVRMVKNIRRVFSIGLNKNSDASTFIHESAHVFLELFADMAERDDAPESVKKDFAATLAWMGVSDRSEITTDLHERWARGFEAYLMEGKSPSLDLEGVFERFRLWLTNIYRTIAALDVELNDEIRGVFDRLLATDEEIAAAQKRSGLVQLFRSPDEMAKAIGQPVTPEEWQAYLDEMEKATSRSSQRLRLRLLKERLREADAWWKEAEARQRELAEARYENLQAVRALTYIKTGTITWISDDHVVRTTTTGNPTRFDKDKVLKVLGVDQLPPYLKPYVRTPRKNADGVMETGTSPDDIAELFGYPTAKALLEALANIPDRTAYVKAETQAAMAAEHGDLMSNRAALREEAEKGVHGEHTAGWLLTEWKALRAKAGGAPPPIMAIRRAAELLAQRRTIGKLDAASALRQERAAGERAAKAAARGDYAQAAVFKQQQLLNFYLHGELLKAREERERFLTLTEKLRDDKARARLGKASPVYRDGVDSILEAFGLREPEERESTPSVAEVVAQMVADSATVLFDEDALAKLLGDPKGWRDLTLSEMRTVAEALKNIDGAARAVRTALVDGQRVAKEIVVAELLREAQENLNSRGPIASSVSASSTAETLGGLMNAIDGSLLKPELIAEMLGGDTIKSMWFRAIVKPLQDAKAREVDLLKAVIAPLLKAFEDMPKSVRARFMEKVDGEALFPGHSVASGQPLQAPTRRFELLMMVLNAGNESNLERLLEGRNITERQLQAAIDLLTKEELDWVQSVWDAAEALWPEASALEERDSGLAPKKIPARKLVTKHGTYRGGYFPAVYDRRVEATGERQVGEAVAALFDPSFSRPATAKSHLKKRAQHFSGALSLEPANIMAHLAQVAHDIAFREAVKSVAGLIMNPEVQAMMKDRLGDGRAKQFLQWVKDVAQMRGAQESQHTSAIMSLVHKVRGNTVIAVMGYSVPTALGDISNVFAAPAASELKLKHWAAGFLAWAHHPFATIAASSKKSGELRTRRDMIRRELVNQTQQLTRKGILNSGPLAFLKQHAFDLFEAIDAGTTTVVWMGAYRQGLAEGLSDADAVTFADRIIRKLFPSHNPVDLAAVLRDKGFVGASLMFYGFFSTAYNRYRAILHPTLNAEGAAATAKTLPQTLTRLASYSLVVSAMAELFSGRGAEEDEEVWEYLLRKMLVGWASSVPWMGDVASQFEARALGKQSNPRQSGLASVAVALGNALLNAADSGADATKRITEVLRAFGPILGVPASQPIRTGKYLVDAVSGDATAENPADVASGLIYGEREGQPANIPKFVGDKAAGRR